MFNKIIATMLVGLCLFIGVGCTSASDVALLQTAELLTNAWLTAYGQAAEIPRVDALFAAAITAVEGYAPGKSCATVIAAVNAVGNALEALAVLNPVGQLALATVIASVDLIASHYSQCSPTVKKKVSARSIVVFPAPKTPKELVKAYAAAGGPLPTK